jgi:hypothetical protein
MKNIIYTILLLISIKVSAQCNYTVTATYTAPSCPTCCDGIIQGGVIGATCVNAAATLQPLGISTPNWKYFNLCAGSYTVVVSDGCACLGTCGVSLPSGSTVIKEFLEETKISIYPNPVANVLHLFFEKEFEPGIEIQIINTLGKVVSETPYNSDINVSSFPSGVYFLKIKNFEKQIAQKKFIITR